LLGQKLTEDTYYLSDVPDVALERRNKIAAIRRDQDLILQPDIAAFGHRAQFQGKDLIRLDDALWGLAIAGPTRSKQWATIMTRLAYRVPQRVLIFWKACRHQILARRFIYLPPFHPWLQRFLPRFDRAHTGVPGLLHRGWHRGFAWATH